MGFGSKFFNSLFNSRNKNKIVSNTNIVEQKDNIFDKFAYMLEGFFLSPEEKKIVKKQREEAKKQIEELKIQLKKTKEEEQKVHNAVSKNSEEMKKGEEACLSVPGLCWDVERWTRIVVKYQDKKWKTRVQKYTWFSAVVIQHEMDHLDWILFTDKVIGKIRKIDETSEY